MNDNKKNDRKIIIGGIVLIVVLFVCVKFIFWGLGAAIHQEHTEVSAGTSMSQDVSASGGQEAPGFCVHCGKGLPKSFEWGQFCPYCGEKVEA